MESALIVSGAMMYVAIVVDIIKTTVSLHAGGWLTTPVANGIWGVFIALSGKNGRSAFLEHAGYIIMLAILLMWVLILWGSFLLLLLAQPDSIIHSTSHLPSDVWQKVYYAGFTLSTLGVGDYVASNNTWRILTTVYSFTGLWLITMAITYFFSVLSGVVNDRQLGIVLRSFGSSPQQIILNSWNGKTFDRLTKQAADIASLLIKHAQNHKAFPVIHYFHTRIPENATLLRIAALYEAMIILKHFVKPNLRPDVNDLASLQTGLDNYLDVIKNVTNVKRSDSNNDIRIDKIIQAGLADPSENKFELTEVQDQRKLLAYLVTRDGWAWEEVVGGRNDG